MLLVHSFDLAQQVDPHAESANTLGATQADADVAVQSPFGSQHAPMAAVTWTV